MAPTKPQNQSLWKLYLRQKVHDHFWSEVDVPPVFAGAGCSTVAVMVEAVAHSTALRSPEQFASLIADKN